MSRFAYVNGRYVRHVDAVVHVEDRGFQLGDGVYEVWAVFGGRLADAEGHFARLERSLAELKIAEPMSRAALKAVIAEVVRRNHVRDTQLARCAALKPSSMFSYSFVRTFATR